jgi:hypothetical protein
MGKVGSYLNPETLEYTTLAEIFRADVSAPQSREYLSPDGSTVIPAFRVFQQGPADNPTGWRFSHTLDTYGFLAAEPGSRVYVSNESEDITYRATLNPDGSLRDLAPFGPRGGESVAAGPDGNVYVANGQVFVYDGAGKLAGEIAVPERPLQLIFGGPGGRTLFVLSHHTLYAIRR